MKTFSTHPHAHLFLFGCRLLRCLAWPLQVAQELFCHDLHVELVQAKADANDADVSRGEVACLGLKKWKSGGCSGLRHDTVASFSTGAVGKQPSWPWEAGVTLGGRCVQADFCCPVGFLYVPGSVYWGVLASSLQ